MIRKNSLNCKLNLKNHSSKRRFDAFMKDFHPENERCPFCNAKGQCRVYASYERFIIDFSDDQVIYDSLVIKRVICSCVHTHAVLPDFIVPYRQYSLPFILHVLMLYYTHSMTLEKIQDIFSVSPELLRRWRNVFGKHKDLWLGIVQSRSISFKVFLDQLLGLPIFSDFLHAFYLKTLLSFLQSHPNPANCRQHPPGFLPS